MINIFYRTIKDTRVKTLKTLRKGVWIEVFNPTGEEITLLKSLGIKPSLLEDAFDLDELARIEQSKKQLYVILNIPFRDQKGVRVLPFLIVITDDFFLTFSVKRISLIQKIVKDPKIYTTQKVKNLLRLCLEVTKAFSREIRLINKEIANKKVNLSKLDNKDIIYFVELEEVLNEFVTSIVALIGVFEKIRFGKYVEIFPEDEVLLEDLVTDSYQSLDMCRTSLKKIVNIREAYSTILTNNLNKIFKFLTSLTVILAVPTIIASIYGMNISLPGQHHPQAFFLILSFTLAVCLVLVLIFYFKKWL